MSEWERYAAAALQGLLSCEAGLELARREAAKEGKLTPFQAAARLAAEVADEMVTQEAGRNG